MHSKVWLILPGGGVKGVFQMGFLRGLFETNKIEIDRVYGTSIGAIMSPLIASKQFDLLYNIFDKVNSINDVLQPWGWFANCFKILPLFTKLGAYQKVKLVDIVLKEIYDRFPSEEITNMFDKCKVVAWDVINKNEVWFTGKDLPIGIKASSALTIAVPPIEYDNMLLTDGGITEIIPITKALEDYEKESDKDDILILIVDCATRVPHKVAKPQNPLFFMIELLCDASSSLTYRELETALTHFPGKIHYIKPKKDVFSNAIDIDKSKMREVLSESYALGLATNLSNLP